MFKWNHELEFFVPRYPDYVETQRINTTELLDVIGNENQKFLDGHLADGQKLYADVEFHKTGKSWQAQRS